MCPLAAHSGRLRASRRITRATVSAGVDSSLGSAWPPGGVDHLSRYAGADSPAGAARDQLEAGLRRQGGLQLSGCHRWVGYRTPRPAPER
jgi:hypothetical protein